MEHVRKTDFATIVSNALLGLITAVLVWCASQITNLNQQAAEDRSAFNAYVNAMERRVTRIETLQDQAIRAAVRRGMLDKGNLNELDDLQQEIREAPGRRAHP